MLHKGRVPSLSLIWRWFFKILMDLPDETKFEITNIFLQFKTLVVNQLNTKLKPFNSIREETTVFSNFICPNLEGT